MGQPTAGAYDWTLVAMSVAVGCLGAFAAFAVADRMQATSEAKLRRRWLAAGSFAMGGGIWAMHFTGMLAFSIHGRVTYDLATTLISIVPAFVGSGVALHTMSRPFAGWKLQQLRALAMALGIGCMHYVGMEAMRMRDDLYYDGALFVLSIAVAHVLATIALHVRQWVSSGGSALAVRFRQAAPTILGFAVAGMHYTAMAAARFYPRPDNAPHRFGFELRPVGMAVAIFLVAAMIAACAIAAVRLDQWLHATAAALHDVKARERTLLESMVEGVLSVDAGAVIESANSAAKRMFGLNDARIEGTRLDKLLPRFLDLAAGDSAATRENDGGRLFDADCVETMARRGDGAEFPVELSASAYEADGRRFFSIIIRDVTQRKQAEQRLRQSQKLQSIGQLAAGIAHEINTPTQYLSDNARFLQDSFEQLANLVRLQQGMITNGRSGPLSPEQAQEHEQACAEADLEFLLEETPRSIEESLEGLGRITSIVRSLKEFSHPDSEEMESADLNRAIASTVTVARNEWKYVAEVETDFDPDLPPVTCHLGDFNQVILNLIVNAAQAIGGSAPDAERKGVIRVATRQENGWVEIRVEDNGPGIPEGIRDRIFDPFFTTKGVGVGSGQGLALAHSVIVNKHGGAITVQSEAGKGATFVLRLPVAGAHATV